MPGSQASQAGTPRHPGLERVGGGSDRPRGSTAGSQRGSTGGSQVGSRAGSPPRASGEKAKSDNRQGVQEVRPVDLVGKRVDLPADAYMEVRYFASQTTISFQSPAYRFTNS